MPLHTKLSAIVARLTDLLCRAPVKAAVIKYTFAERRADFIARRITDLEDILGNLRDQQALCDRAADIAYEELEQEELNALLREHHELLDCEARVREGLAYVCEEIEEIEAELARRGAL